MENSIGFISWDFEAHKFKSLDKKTPNEEGYLDFTIPERGVMIVSRKLSNH